MPYRVAKAERGGFTLVEIMIALAILAIVLVIAVSNFQGMMEKYRVEGETKQMFADLMDARSRAMQRNRVFIVQINSTGINSKDYKTYEDTNPAVSDGNGLLEATLDTLVSSATVQHTITWNSGGVSGFPITFNRNGIASVTGFIRFSSATQADYDCITVNPTRIKMGQYVGASCVEK